MKINYKQAEKAKLLQERTTQNSASRSATNSATLTKDIRARLGKTRAQPFSAKRNSSTNTPTTSSNESSTAGNISTSESGPSPTEEIQNDVEKITEEILGGLNKTGKKSEKRLKLMQQRLKSINAAIAGTNKKLAEAFRAAPRTLFSGYAGQDWLFGSGSRQAKHKTAMNRITPLMQSRANLLQQKAQLQSQIADAGGDPGVSGDVGGDKFLQDTIAKRMNSGAKGFSKILNS